LRFLWLWFFRVDTRQLKPAGWFSSSTSSRRGVKTSSVRSDWPRLRRHGSAGHDNPRERICQRQGLQSSLCIESSHKWLGLLGISDSVGTDDAVQTHTRVPGVDSATRPLLLLQTSAVA